VVLVLLLGAPAGAQRASAPAVVAAKHFARGQKLFAQGAYAEAIKAFNEAHRLTSVSAALFNIARCHESLGNVAAALEFYGKALKATNDGAVRADIERRITQLRSLPEKIFVSSEPTGAAVTVDGSASPESQRTPVVLKLRPGEHVLLVAMEGHHLLAQRVVVEAGKELPVHLRLQKVAAPCPPPPAPPAPCPAVKPCPELKLTDMHNLHIHLSILGAFGFSTDSRPTPMGGPGFHAYFTYRRWMVGAHVQAFPMGELQTTLNIGGTTYQRARTTWILGQLEGGYVFPFPTLFIYTSLGAGLAADHFVYVQPGARDRATDASAFIWTAGSGIEAMATRWLSMGAGLRLGMGYGDRAATEGTEDITKKAFLVFTLWGNATFHL
jgi:hypothetical protein